VCKYNFFGQKGRILMPFSKGRFLPMMVGDFAESLQNHNIRPFLFL